MYKSNFSIKIKKLFAHCKNCLKRKAWKPVLECATLPLQNLGSCPAEAKLHCIIETSYKIRGQKFKMTILQNLNMNIKTNRVQHRILSLKIQNLQSVLE